MRSTKQFILFGNIGDESSRNEFAQYLLSKLEGKKTILPKKNTFNSYLEAINSIIDDKQELVELATESATVKEQVFEEIINLVKNSHRASILEESNLQEKKTLDNLAVLSPTEFKKSWTKNEELLNPVKEDINLDFYKKQWGILKQKEQETKKEKNTPNKQLGKIQTGFNILKKHIYDSLEKQFLYKKAVQEIAIIDKWRKKLVNSLYKKVDQLSQLKKLLNPFTKNLGRLWDLSEGSWQNINFNVLKKYSEILKNDASLQELAELLGRYRKAEIEYEEKLIKTTEIKTTWVVNRAAKSELVGVRESNDLNNLLPAELALLSDELMTYAFYKKFAEHKLQTYKFIGREQHDLIVSKKDKQQVKKKKDKGPIIVCVDTSGSMHGTPEHVAKVLSFALLKIALEEERKCFLISFSTSIETLELTQLAESLDRLVSFLSMSFHGGTDPHPALEKALKMTKKETYADADILLISDFVINNLDDNMKELIKRIKEKGNKLNSLVIGDSYNIHLTNQFTNNWIYTPNERGNLIHLVEQVRKSF